MGAQPRPPAADIGDAMPTTPSPAPDTALQSVSPAAPLVLSASALGSRHRDEVLTLVGCMAVVPVAAVLFFIAPLLGGASLVAISVAIPVLLGRRQGQWRQFGAEIDPAIIAMARGDLAKAHATFRWWAEHATAARISALAWHNLAWTLMLRGELQQAIDALIVNDDHNEAPLRQLGLFATSAVDLALGHALVGDLPAAEAWMAKADERRSAMGLISVPAMMAFTRAVVDCRSGRAADAARMLDEGWVEYEGVLTGATLRPMRIVRAFAIAASGPRSAGLAEAVLATARPAYPGEYDFLGVAWPEMASFLAAHGIGSRPAAPAAFAPA